MTPEDEEMENALLGVWHLYGEVVWEATNTFRSVCGRVILGQTPREISQLPYCPECGSIRWGTPPK